MRVEFQAYQTDAVQAAQQIVKRDLESIGVEVALEIVDSSIMFSDDPASNPDTLWRFNADMQIFTHNTYSPDPAAYMKDWTCDQIPQQENNWVGYNVERWCNPEYDALYLQALKELDPDKRQEIFIQMNDMLIEDVVMIPLVHRSWISGANKNIDGIQITPWDNELWNVKDWRYRLP
jgi:peptide/nickel transport system substrate-binding protein